MGYLDRVEHSSTMSRRGFVKASAAATAALAAGAGLAGCASNNVKEIDHEPNPRDITSGEWKSAACWHNCGGKCLNKVLVKDGVVVRQKTDDTHEDTEDFPQQRSCLRGRSQRNHVFAADRLKYPMKRKSWQPGGGENSHGELRGKDEWERIAWEEAMDLIAEETKRIVAEHGNEGSFRRWSAGAQYPPCCGNQVLGPVRRLR